MTSLYAHFPWCVKKCPYCDFNSHPLDGSLANDRYIDALILDLNTQRAAHDTHRFTTVFFGGGTPSLFDPADFGRLLAQVSCDGEVTMEANPGTTEHADFAAYARAGINRLSLGVQSFSATMLQRLGRIHSAEDAARAVRAARRGGFENINLDIMYGLPEQTLDEALMDLRRAISLAPEHISWYQLTIEPKTAFHSRPPTLPDETLLADMEAHGWLLLNEAGYRRYEVSAWSQPDRACQHNLNYWRFGDYLGIGAGAHGKLGRQRTDKAKAPSRYLSAPAETNYRTLVDDDLRFEYLLNALRLVEGTSWDVFTERTGLAPMHDDPTWRRGCALGLLQSDRVATTPLGYRHLDSVLTMFLDAG